MTTDETTVTARRIMEEFARNTGLSPAGPVPRRYLWTDAFAVCNFLCLYEVTGDKKMKELALHLVDQVHEVLGRHRGDDGRKGWISGMGEEEGKLHPTAGGLRIGKKLRERRATEPLNERAEWDRDGQYYHYLTKWMHALNRVTEGTGDFAYNKWAVELAKAAHERFVFSPPQTSRKRMYWKMSINLSYPLVSSMGQHDPLDGLITYVQLASTAAREEQGGTRMLDGEIGEMAEMCRGMNWATDDALGLGGLLSDAYRVAQLMGRASFSPPDLLATLLDAALQGLAVFRQEQSLDLAAGERLAFRELGLSIGVRATERLSRLAERHGAIFGEQDISAQLKELARYRPMADKIEKFWLSPEHQLAETWIEHADINMVMLATSLCPDGYLNL